MPEEEFMVRKPTSGDSEQREREAERARRASQISAAGGTGKEQRKQSPRGRPTPSNGGPEEESAHGALIREGIDSD
jgi:hypothetical protein